MKKAFTLVELAIVLVIIGLLVGGVVAGQSLIQSAKVSKAVAEQKEIVTAFNAFKLEYNGLPGDLKDASLYGIGTNGDGDKTVDIYTESLEFYTHLINAKILPNQKNSSNYYVSDFGNNALWYSGYIGDDNNPHFSQRGNFAILTYITCSVGWCAVLTPKEAMNFDSKSDDGKASLGKVLGINGHDANNSGLNYYCNTSDGTVTDWQKPAGSVDYKLSVTTRACRMFIKLD